MLSNGAHTATSTTPSSPDNVRPFHLRGKTVMLDCGIHPGFTGPASLPYFDEVEMEEVDVMLVTHFHLDHVAAVPYVATKTTFKVGTAAAPPCMRVHMQAVPGEHTGAEWPSLTDIYFYK
jgi:Cft2 family RNA processing exonuclease